MAWIARDSDDNLLHIFSVKPHCVIRVYGSTADCDRYSCWRVNELWSQQEDSTLVELPDDADEKLIGRHLTWEDEPVEI